jgi:hypothetical protein
MDKKFVRNVEDLPRKSLCMIEHGSNCVKKFEKVFIE